MSVTLKSYPSHQREQLASKVLEIGRSFLSDGARNDERKIDARAEDAVRWLQKAFSLAEPLDDTLTAGAVELKRCILRNLARAYVLSSGLNPENLACAETALDELLDSIPPDDRKDVANQELHRWKLAVLRRRNAPEDALFESEPLSRVDVTGYQIQSLTDHGGLSLQVIHYHPYKSSVLLDLRTLSHHQLVVKIIQLCLQASLGAVNDSGLPFVERLLLAMIFHCSKDADHARAMRDLRETCSLLESAEFELPDVGATACLMYGERRRSLKRCSDAVDWFLLGTRKAFSSVADSCASKCFRKAALCHIEEEEYAQASDIIRQCPGQEAATHYLSFLVAIKQAIRAVKAMVHGSGFDERMLLMATRLAHETDLKNVLLAVLQELLDHVTAGKTTGMNVEPVTLIRCMIRLVLRLITDPANAEGKDDLIGALIQHFATEERVPPLFDVSREVRLVLFDTRVTLCFKRAGTQLLETYLETALEMDEEMHLCVVFSSFAATSARVFAMRKLEPHMVKSDKLEFTAHEIQACEERLRRIMEKGVISSNNIPRVTRCLRTVFIFQTELACRMKEWQVIPKVIEKVTQCQAPLCDTFETIADMLWSAHDCPADVLFVALEARPNSFPHALSPTAHAILHASLDRSALSVEKFARWLRAICTMLLARNTAPDRLKAIDYIEQAIVVLEEHGGDDVGDETYPIDERYWLLTSSYNTGIECLHVYLLDDARRWFEASSRICTYVPDGALRAKKITETYTQLMDRFGS
ncbi:hypothetical protein BC827DRAFT_1265857 [Russula dissimulans]|nr:hypothetical protein BC827DRAFT_1265857 [Russula dissimulans]